MSHAVNGAFHRVWESAHLVPSRQLAFFKPQGVTIPVAVTAFPDELYQAPRSWTAQAYPNLIYYNKVDKGGHFAAWEQPQISPRKCAQHLGR